jgi:hypothetical protein
MLRYRLLTRAAQNGSNSPSHDREGVVPLALVWVLLLAPPAMAGAAERCPWLNAATAGGVLGGAVTEVTVERAKSGDDASCGFVRHDGAAVSELRIETETMRDPARDFAAYAAARCHSTAMPLKAIGNQAVACSGEGGDGRIAELVVGRVRDRAFLVRIGAIAASPDVLREKARKVAEQVAGILF